MAGVVPVISTYRVLACCWVLSPCLLLMCMGNGPQVRQDLCLPAARGRSNAFQQFPLSLQGSIHLAVPARPFPSPASNQLLRSGRILAKISQTFDRQAVGCNLAVLKSALSQPHCSHCKVQASFLAPPYEQFNSLILVEGACDSRHPEQRPRGAGGAGGAALVAPTQARARPKRPHGGGEKKCPPTPLARYYRSNPRDSQEPAGKSPRI
jgi:hypothetical protein